jgi:hypothetical protein
MKIIKIRLRMLYILEIYMRRKSKRMILRTKSMKNLKFLSTKFMKKFLMRQRRLKIMKMLKKNNLQKLRLRPQKRIYNLKIQQLSHKT